MRTGGCGGGGTSRLIKGQRAQFMRGTEKLRGSSSL